MQEGVNKMKAVNGWLQPIEIGRYGTDYDTRAGITLVGLGANRPEDTFYPTAYIDGEGKPLDSANKYVMHYEKDDLQPTNAAWSISQYKGNFYEHNVLERYAIAPWMPLKFNADGSLDIYLQANSPGSDKEANWLPTPAGQFNITIRNYFRSRRRLTASMKIHRSSGCNREMDLLRCSGRSHSHGPVPLRQSRAFRLADLGHRGASDLPQGFRTSR
jgi:hypothetical protein